MRDPVNGTANVIKFQFKAPRSGWRLSCRVCGNAYYLPYTAATIRDGRQDICVPCFMGVRYA